MLLAIFSIICLDDKYVKQISLQTKSSPYGINVEYGLKSGSNSEIEFDNYWDNKNTKKTLINNATVLFILVKNVDYINFSVDKTPKHLFRIYRTDLETLYGRDLRNYAEDKILWEKEVINETINSSNKLEDFNKLHRVKIE